MNLEVLAFGQIIFDGNEKKKDKRRIIEAALTSVYRGILFLPHFCRIWRLSESNAISEGKVSAEDFLLHWLLLFCVLHQVGRGRLS